MLEWWPCACMLVMWYVLSAYADHDHMQPDTPNHALSEHSCDTCSGGCMTLCVAASWCGGVGDTAEGCLSGLHGVHVGVPSWRVSTSRMTLSSKVAR